MHIARNVSVFRDCPRRGYNILSLNLGFISIASFNFDCSTFFVLPRSRGKRNKQDFRRRRVSSLDETRISSSETTLPSR